MGFAADWANLEQEFLEQVRRDNEDGFPHAHYVSNFVPKKKVDFVLIAMEPSLGGGKPCDPASCQCVDNKSKNFSFSIQDFILHFCIRNYLCTGGQGYHLTDLAKGGMSVWQAKDKQWERWNRWYHLLEKELLVVAEPGARVIPIGNDVHRFLNAKKPKNRGSIVHYSPNNGKAQKKAAQQQPDAYEKFRNTVTAANLEDTVQDVLKCEPNAPSIEDTLNRLQIHSRFSEHKRKLMFSYKVAFERLLRGATCDQPQPQ